VSDPSPLALVAAGLDVRVGDGEWGCFFFRPSASSA